MKKLLQLVVQLFSVQCHRNRDFLDFEAVVQLSYPIDRWAAPLNLQVRFLEMNLAAFWQENLNLLADQSSCLFSNLVSNGIKLLDFADSIPYNKVLDLDIRTQFS